jgi:hypothetical protein
MLTTSGRNIYGVDKKKWCNIPLQLVELSFNSNTHDTIYHKQ